MADAALSANAFEHLDVLIVGAGISGIDAAYHLQRRCPDKSWLILEARDAIGGTWDLFRYPGIRSDSDMHTLGYNFKPWKNPKAIADGPAIRAYVQKAAQVTMLQRSPTYMVSFPAIDPIANGFRRYLPLGLAYRLTRWKNMLLQ